MTTNYFRDKVVIITGSGRGIGKALAENLGLKGAKIILNGRTESTLVASASELTAKGIICHTVMADVSDPEGAKLLIAESVSKWGRIDILINNAGLGSRGFFENSKAEVWSEILKINTLGYIYPTLEALPYLKASKGNLLFISSLAGRFGIPGNSTYSVSKMALTALHQSLEIEMERYGVCVSIAYVGFTQNDPSKQMMDGDGTMKPMGYRPPRLIAPMDKVADQLARMLEKRRRVKVLSLLGHLQSCLFFIPAIRRSFMRRTMRQYYKLFPE